MTFLRLLYFFLFTNDRIENMKVELERFKRNRKVTPFTLDLDRYIYLLNKIARILGLDIVRAKKIANQWTILESLSKSHIANETTTEDVSKYDTERVRIYQELKKLHYDLDKDIEALEQMEELIDNAISKTGRLYSIGFMIIPFVLYYYAYNQTLKFNNLQLLFWVSIPLGIYSLYLISKDILEYLDIGISKRQQKEEQEQEFLDFQGVNQIQTDIDSKTRYNTLIGIFYDLESRLKEEMKRLNKKANVNLWLGVLTTLFAIGIALAFFFLIPITGLSIRTSSDATVLAFYFVPRITLITLIEVFSFYFLRLYRANLQEIQYYQNELTDISYKLLGFKAALLGKDEEHIKVVINEIMKKEHNKVIKKDETTADIEKYKYETTFHQDLISNFFNIMGIRSKSTEEQKNNEKQETEKKAN